MKKVLIVATVQSHIAQFHKPLIKMLQKYNYEVHIAAKDNLAEKKELELKEPNRVFNIPFDRKPLAFSNFKAYRELKRILEQNKYDIVHCNTPVGGVLSRVAVKNLKKEKPKVFYTAHGFHFYKGAPFKNWIFYYPIEKFLARYTDKIITITEEDYLLAKKKFPTTAYHMHGVGVDPRKFYPYDLEKRESVKEKEGFDKDDFIVLNVGELNNNKNQEAIIRAIKKTEQEIPNIKLLIAGNGPNEHKLKNLSKKLGLEEKILFLGYTRELRKYYNIANVVVSASYREGLPLNIVESLLCGTPVIASNNRGHREIVNKDNGYLVNSPNDSEEYSKYIYNLYLNTDKLINKEVNKTVKKYTVDNVIKTIEKVYEL